MSFEKHIFISYAHVDNKITPDDDRGWVTRFHEYLACYLSTNIGEEARIWRDERLRGNDIFANEIVKQFSGTATLVTVLSPRYFESEWCLKELEEFCRAAQKTGGLVIDDKARVLRVMLKPIPPEMREKLPDILKDALGYEFYHEVEGKRVLPLDPSFGSAEAYRRNVYFVAEDIAELIRKLEQQPHDSPATATEQQTGEKPTVYLAECSYDRAEDREKLRGELRANGYTIIPEQRAQLPDLEAKYVPEVERLLNQCQLSVHLIGSFPGKIPDGPSGKSAVQWQNELAAKLSRERGLERLIWLPAGAQTQEEQSSFIRALSRDAELQNGADLIAGDFEELKTAMRAALKKLEQPKTLVQPQQGAQRSVYVICLDTDMETVGPLMEFLEAQGFTVELPVFSGEATAVRQANEALAMSCQGAILFCGAADGGWMFHQQNELKRVEGLRRDTPWRVRFTYLSAPATADKRAAILKKTPNLINALDGFSPEKMKPFLDTMGKL